MTSSSQRHNGGGGAVAASNALTGVSAIVVLCLLIAAFQFGAQQQCDGGRATTNSGIAHEYVTERFLFHNQQQSKLSCIQKPCPECPDVKVEETDEDTSGDNAEKTESQGSTVSESNIHGNNIASIPRSERETKRGFDLLYRRSPQQQYQFEQQQIDEQDLLQRQREWTKEQWADDTMKVIERNRLNESESGDYLIVTASNLGTAEMTMNWAASLLMNQYSKFVIMCFDFELYKLLWQYGLKDNAAMVPTLWTNLTIASGHAEWATNLYMDLITSRTLMLMKLLKLKFHVLFTDVDLVFLSPHVLQHVIFGTDQSKPDLVYMVDNSMGTPDVINGGFLLLRPTKVTEDLLDRTMFWMQSGNKKFAFDQTALNHVVDGERKIKFSKHVRALDKTLYASGWTLKRKHKNEDFLIYPMVAHFNWIAHTKNKRKYMRQVNMWFIGDKFAHLAAS